MTTNTRTSLWPDRWPAIALQACIDLVEAAPPEQADEVKWALPCDTCSEAPRCLNAKRKELGGLMYDREILTRPRASESSLFPYELFEPCLLPGQELVRHFTKPFGNESRFAVASAWDIAWSERSGGDWLVRMTGLLDRQTGRRRLLDIGRWQKVSFDDQIDLIGLGYSLFHDDVVVIESDAAQAVWAQRVAKETDVPVLAHNASQKRDFSAGVPGLIIDLENRKWEFPHTPGSYHFENLYQFLAEAEAFGWIDGRLSGVGEHDDCVMAYWHVNYALTLMSAPNLARGEHHRGVQPGRYV